MIDYHIHTKYSDGKSTHTEYIQKAIEIGLEEIGFSDHYCVNFPKWAIKAHDEKLITNQIDEYKNLRGIRVKYGYECDYIEGKEQQVKEFIENLPLDYVIGSVHYIKDWNFDTRKDDFIDLDIDQFYLDYFDQLKKAIESGLFDIIGHIDLAKKFNFFPSYNLDELYEGIAKSLKKNNVAFELNTSGMDKDCKEFYPSDKFLNVLCKHQVNVTLGSDSHKKEHLARYFDLAIAKLKKIGFEKIATFSNRKISYIKI